MFSTLKAKHKALKRVGQTPLVRKSSWAIGDRKMNNHLTRLVILVTIVMLFYVLDKIIESQPLCFPDSQAFWELYSPDKTGKIPKLVNETVELLHLEETREAYSTSSELTVYSYLKEDCAGGLFHDEELSNLVPCNATSFKELTIKPIWTYYIEAVRCAFWVDDYFKICVDPEGTDYSGLGGLVGSSARRYSPHYLFQMFVEKENSFTSHIVKIDFKRNVNLAYRIYDHAFPLLDTIGNDSSKHYMVSKQQPGPGSWEFSSDVILHTKYRLGNVYSTEDISPVVSLFKPGVDGYTCERQSFICTKVEIQQMLSQVSSLEYWEGVAEINRERLEEAQLERSRQEEILKGNLESLEALRADYLSLYKDIQWRDSTWINIAFLGYLFKPPELPTYKEVQNYSEDAVESLEEVKNRTELPIPECIARMILDDPCELPTPTPSPDAMERVESMVSGIESTVSMITSLLSSIGLATDLLVCLYLSIPTYITIKKLMKERAYSIISSILVLLMSLAPLCVIITAGAFPDLYPPDVVLMLDFSMSTSGIICTRSLEDLKNEKLCVQTCIVKTTKVVEAHHDECMAYTRLPKTFPTEYLSCIRIRDQPKLCPSNCRPRLPLGVSLLQAYYYIQGGLVPIVLSWSKTVLLLLIDAFWLKGWIYSERKAAIFFLKPEIVKEVMKEWLSRSLPILVGLIIDVSVTSIAYTNSITTTIITTCLSLASSIVLPIIVYKTAGKAAYMRQASSQ